MTSTLPAPAAVPTLHTLREAGIYIDSLNIRIGALEEKLDRMTGLVITTLLTSVGGLLTIIIPKLIGGH